METTVAYDAGIDKVSCYDENLTPEEAEMLVREIHALLVAREETEHD